MRGERAKKKLEKAFSFMIRLRLPGGLVSPSPVAAARRHRDDLCQRLAASHDARNVPVSRRHQIEPSPHHAGDQRRLPRHHRGLRRRQPQRHVRGQPVLLAGACCSGRVRAQGQRPSVAEDERLSRDLARRREGRRTCRARRSSIPNRFTASIICRASSRSSSPFRPRTTATCLAHDLGFIAITDAKGELVGWNVSVGGGMGR